MPSESINFSPRPRKERAPLPPKKERAEEVIELAPEELEEVVEEEPVELAAEELEEVREPGELQDRDVVAAFEISGFPGLEVAATLEVKNARKENERDRNQDNIITDVETGILGVLDGLGGEAGGDLASQTAEEAIPKRFTEALEALRGKNATDIGGRIVELQLKRLGISNIELTAGARKHLTDMVETVMTQDPDVGRKALALIEAVKAASNDVKETGGKTTACVGFVHEMPDGSQWAVVSNVGDSGAFKRRKNGEMVPLTEEDSLYNHLMNAGSLSPEMLARMKKNPGRAFPVRLAFDQFVAIGGNEETYKKLDGTLTISYNKMKSVMTSALGGRAFEPALEIRKLAAGDELVFATDGVIDKFEDQNTEMTDLDELASAMSLGGKTQLDRMDAFRKIAKKRTTYKTDDDIAIVSARVAPRRTPASAHKNAA